MKRIAICGLFCLLAGGAMTGRAQETSDSLLMARQQQLREASQPGPEHELLARLTGTFEMDISMFMAPGEEPLKSTGKTTNRMILDGRFLEMRGEGKMGGATIKNLSIIGYDRRHQHFTVTGFDNTGTYSVSATGFYDDVNRTIVLEGTDEDPIFEMVQEYTFTIEMIDDDTFKWLVTFYNPEMTQGEDEFTMVEITYTRTE